MWDPEAAFADFQDFFFFSQPYTGSKPEQLAKGLQALLARQNLGRVSMPQILYIFIYIFMARLGNILGYGNSLASELHLRDLHSS
jgi:hypothetical protein